MLYVRRGDMFAVQADAYVHTANCVGAMGKGVASVFERRWPEYAASYRARAFEAHPGQLWIDHDNRTDQRIITAFTKQHWRNPSRLEWIELIAIQLRNCDQLLMRESVHVVSMPPLGCGNGRLDWDLVQQMLIDHLEPCRVTYVVSL